MKRLRTLRAAALGLAALALLWIIAHVVWRSGDRSAVTAAAPQDERAAGALAHPLEMRARAHVEPPPTALVVRIHDAVTGSPVPRAQVWIGGSATGERRLMAPRTGDPGAWTILRESNSPDRTCWVEASAPGYHSQRSAVSGTQSEVELGLVPLDALKGLVRFSSTGKPAAGMAVLAKQADIFGPTTGQLLQVMRGEVVEGFELVETDGQGAFQIPVVRPEARYTLRAGGDGYLSATWLHGVTGVGDQVDLLVSPVFATQLRLCEGGGAPLRLSPSLEGKPGSGLPMSFGSADPLLKPMSGDLLGFMLATGSEPPVLDGSREQLLMAVGGPAADVAGPNWVQCRVPGYRTARRTFFSDRVSPDPGWLVVELQPSCDSWGSVLVSAEGVPEGLGEERLPGGIGGYLVLGSAEREDWFPFALPLQGTRRLDGVPTGTYHVHFRNLQGEKQHLLEGDQALVEIGAEETSLRFDLRAAGAVEFTLLDQRGDPYGGWFVADLARGEPRVVNGRLRMADAQRYTFPGPPYVVPLLREGGYFLGVHRPRIGESIESSILRIETARGKTQHVVLTCDGEVR